MRTRMRTARGPSGSSHQRTVSHETSAIPKSAMVYTFSLTTDCAQTVNAVDPISAATEIGPSGSSHQRTVSHETSAIPKSAMVYTFSLTTDCAQTVNAVDPISAATAPPTIRCQRSGSQDTRTRSVIRNHIPAEAALQSAARMLILIATLGAIGRRENTRPMRTKNGLPGGCGRPRRYAATMYSLVSHMAVFGDRVIRYRSRTAA